MTDQLVTRIEKLERQNKRMKVAMSALCLCLVALLTMAQTSPQTTQNTMESLEVREIVLSDGEMRAKLTAESLVFSGKPESGPAFASAFAPASEKATITASGISLAGRYVTEIRPTGLICSRDGAPRFDLNVGEIGAALAFQDGSGRMRTMLDETTMVLKSDSGMLSMRPQHIFLQKERVDALLTSGSLTIRDADEHKAILGQTNLTAPKADDARAGSAASLTLLGKDDTVVWHAP